MHYCKSSARIFHFCQPWRGLNRRVWTTVAPVANAGRRLLAGPFRAPIFCRCARKPGASRAPTACILAGAPECPVFGDIACPLGPRDRSDILGYRICGWQQWCNMRFHQFLRTALPQYLRSGLYLAPHMPLDTVTAALTWRQLGGLFVSGQGRSACLAAGVCVWHASGYLVGVSGWSAVLSPQRSLEDRRHLIG